ncbi:hypothetical protein ES705_33486 [subsurface metagenome]
MGKPVSFLYNLARMAHDIKKIKSGYSKKGARRVKNKIIGRESIKKIWVMRGNLRNEKEVFFGSLIFNISYIFIRLW